MATIKALEQIGTDQAREMLSLAETSSEPEVQELASAALTALKADDDLVYAVSPTMIERGLFGVPASARRPGRDLSRYDAPTEEGWANVDSEGLGSRKSHQLLKTSAKILRTTWSPKSSSEIPTPIDVSDNHDTATAAMIPNG